MDKALTKVVQFARDHGVEVQTHSKQYLENETKLVGYSIAPFSDHYAIHWKDKILVLTEEAPWPGCVHELGHLITCGKDPNNCDELSFLGWEVALMKYLKLDMFEWLESNRNYVIYGEAQTDLGHLSERDRSIFLRERMLYAREHDLLDSKNRPLAIR